jgi:hypothetical protein
MNVTSCTVDAMHYNVMRFTLHRSVLRNALNGFLLVYSCHKNLEIGFCLGGPPRILLSLRFGAKMGGATARGKDWDRHDNPCSCQRSGPAIITSDASALALGEKPVLDMEERLMARE